MKILFPFLLIIGLITLVIWISKSPEEKISDNSPASNELIKEDISVGQGKEVTSGDTVKVHYVGTLTNGEKFDSSIDRGQPFEFTVGSGSVIEGWEKGILGMKVGGKRKLLIPPEIGYGQYGSPPKIPGNATLIFEIDLLEISNAG